MNKEYVKPTAELVEFESDVMTTSGHPADWCYVSGGNNTEGCTQHSDWVEGMNNLFSN